MWTSWYHEWHGSIAPPYYSLGVRSGLWTLASSSWRTQRWRSTAFRSKTLTSTMKGPTCAQSSLTRNQKPQKCISLFKVSQTQPSTNNLSNLVRVGGKSKKSYAFWFFLLGMCLYGIKWNYDSILKPVNTADRYRFRTLCIKKKNALDEFHLPRLVSAIESLSLLIKSFFFLHARKLQFKTFL